MVRRSRVDRRKRIQQYREGNREDSLKKTPTAQRAAGVCETGKCRTALIYMLSELDVSGVDENVASSGSVSTGSLDAAHSSA